MNAPHHFLTVTVLTIWFANGITTYAAGPMNGGRATQTRQTDVTANGPPSNLKSGPFRSLVESMWVYSARFRRQCQRLAAARELVVVLLVNTTDKRSTAHASTEMWRKDGVSTMARVTIRQPNKTVELIAHEIEHVIEQLDGVAPGEHADARRTHETGPAYESLRAREAGLCVAREVDEGRGRVVSTVQGQDPVTTAADPAPASISADGRFTAFTSTARLTADDTNDVADLYVLDLTNGRTTLESPQTGWAQRYRPQLYPRISGDGQLIVFQAVDGQGPGWWQTLLLDRQDGSVRVLSVSADGELANGHCTQAAISSDGSTVVFESAATNLVGRDGNARIADIYAVRLDTGDIARVNVDTNGSPPFEGASITPSVSENGRLVAFVSTADLACDLKCTPLAIRPHKHPQIYVRDTHAQSTIRVTRSIRGKEPNGGSSWPALSGDGRYVAFASEASNLVREDDNNRRDVFLYDIAANRIEVVSHNPDGHHANGASTRPAISRDGQTVAFQSLASDLTCGNACGPSDRDINLLWDVFVYDRPMKATVRTSADDSGEWTEPSRTPSIDASGTVMIFASRHPTDEDDVDNDDDLFLWVRGAMPSARGSLLGLRR